MIAFMKTDGNTLPAYLTFLYGMSLHRVWRGEFNWFCRSACWLARHGVSCTPIPRCGLTARWGGVPAKAETCHRIRVPGFIADALARALEDINHEDHLHLSHST
jgi:hypothetical protein